MEICTVRVYSSVGMEFGLALEKEKDKKESGRFKRGVRSIVMLGHAMRWAHNESGGDCEMKIGRPGEEINKYM